MSLKTKIEKVMELSSAAEVEHDALVKKHFGELGMTVGSPEAQAYQQEPTPEMDVLKAELESYSEEDVRRIQTVMYAGREKESDINDMHRELTPRTSDKTHAVRTIMDKSPRGGYLADGLRMAEKAGFDLDDGWQP